MSSCKKNGSARTSSSPILAIALLPVLFGLAPCKAEEPAVIPSCDLKDLPHVHSITFALTNGAERQIIHLLDWHFVPEADFAADLRDQSSSPISDEEIERLYDAFLDEVEAVQQEQMAILRALIRDHGVTAIYKEGLTPENLSAFEKLVAALKKFGQNKPKGETPIEQFLLDQYRQDLLQIGAAGRLLLSGELKAILPAEDAECMEAANPVGADGKVRFDAEADERREDAIVRSILGGERVAFIVLGGDHDLADNVQRLSDGSCHYVRIESKGYREVSRCP